MALPDPVRVVAQGAIALPLRADEIAAGKLYSLEVPEVGTVYLSASHSDWINVYIKSDDTFDRFGYNTEEDRWAYGERPVLPNGLEKICRLTNAGAYDHSGRGCEVGCAVAGVIILVIILILSLSL